MMKLTAAGIYKKLLEDDKILEVKGQIRFFLGEVNIIVKQRDVVGNIIQEWLQGWLEKNNIAFAPSENTQMPPDFYLDPDDKTKNLLEIKAFNRSANPGFDIADFRAYSEEIIRQPYMLYADYLIFGYDMSDEGIVTIKDLWLKKVWQICRCMNGWALNLQIKQNVVHKIRPGVWYSAGTKYPMFDCIEDFLAAIEETAYQDPRTRNHASRWKSKFLRNYKNHYGSELVIPHWADIKEKYDKNEG